MAYWFSFDELSAISIASSFSENTLHDSFIYRDHPIVGHKRPMELSQTVEERPLKNPKTSHSWNNNSSYHENDQMSSSQSVAYPNYSHLINSNNFTNQQVVTMKPKEETTLSCSSITFAADHHNNLVCHQDSFANQNYMFKKANNSCQGANKSVSTNNGKLTQAQDDITVRGKDAKKKLSQRFIALSALIPGLKRKMDKASVLGDAIKYLKQLQQSVKTLEEQTPKKSVESQCFS
ncbi:Transcription factor bHLH18 [Capsicum annuum]|uniref:Transcription factor bHLH18 n=1 Tax=Capsicum annuum TaxID=4072 RepID=A0A2G2YFQ3_CAPAN|nr:Transcription factor bHLH18 [Capsicum annuum]